MQAKPLQQEHAPEVSEIPEVSGVSEVSEDSEASEVSEASEMRIAPLRESLPDEPFVKLFVETEPALRAFIFSQVPNWADMGEILQQTSIVLWKKFDQFEQGTEFRNWAFKIARYEVLNYLRKQRRSKLVFSDDVVELLGTEDPREQDRLEQQRHILADCLQKLQPHHRELVERFYQGDRSMDDLVSAYKKSAMALYQRVHRLRVLLMNCVQKTVKREEEE